MEYNLVEMWLRKDPTRWLAGAIAGLVAGAIAIGLAMIIASSGGLESWFPIKLIGTILLGPSSLEMGASAGVLAGGSILGVLFMFLGVVFAHFTGTNSLAALLPMGVVWGTFSWIFTWNLFLQSFRPIFAARVPSAPVFPVCIAFGVSLALVSFIDRMMRRTKAG